MNTPNDATSEVQRVFTTKEQTRKFYNKISRYYDMLAEASEHPMRERGLQVLAVQPGEKVLEVGYGTGGCLVELARAVGPAGKVFGIDLSEGMRQVAEEKLRAAAVAERVELVCGDALHLPYAEGSLDAVFMSFTLELFDTPEIPRVLAECKRVLRSGGRLGVVAVSKEGGEGVVLHLYEWSHEHFPNLVDCRPIFVQRSMEEAGWRIASAERKMMWVPVEIVVGIKA